MRLLSFTTWVFFHVFLFLIVFELNSSNIWVHGQCLNDQKALLIQLNQSLTSFSIFSASFIWVPSKRSSWRSNTDCCKDWSGIGCDTGGHVNRLDLSSEFISGGLNGSSSLFKLKYLESLNLAFNSFSQTPISSGFGSLTNLTYLNLSNSGFSGQIPTELSRMTRLVTLDLSSFQPGSTSLTLKNPDLGTLIRNLKELKVLYLDGVNISADGSKWCKAISSSLPKLQVLSLSNCYLSGPLDKSLLQLQSLNELRLNQNNISAEVPEFFSEFHNLSTLHLSSCGLYGRFPDRVLQLKTLRSLYVSANKLLQGSLPEFSKDELLEDLVLSGTSFAGELPHSIGNLTFLSRLELENCSFNGSIPSSISNLSKLQYLDISMNGFTGLIPSDGWSKSLRNIDLSYNYITGPIPFEWTRLPKLVNLNLKNNSLNGAIPSALFTLPSLQKLELAMNQFNGSVAEFSNGSSSSLLEIIDLSINKLHGAIPVSIFDLSRLKILTLSSNDFSGTSSLEIFFQKFKNLSSLDLSSNRLSITTAGDSFASFPQVGTLKLRSCNLTIFPTFLSNQSRLTYLDLSDNQMKGNIPNWISMLGTGTLTHLNLSHNFLEDPELPFPPNSFESLAVLILRSNLLQGKNPILPASASVLDYSSNNFTTIQNISSYLSVAIYFSLSNNQLIGEIPESVCAASYLQVLDLSHNYLSGEIPPCLGYITRLGVLNLRGNHFRGNMPNTFLENCTLETLDLNQNQFEGHLPRSLANCAKLEVLDLGNNQLTGEFPSWLGSMDNLRVLVLRSNRFYGSLGDPAGPEFSQLQIVDISSNKFTGTLSSKCFSSWTGMMVNEDEAKSNHKRKILVFKVLQFTRLYYQDAVMVTSKGLDMELVKILTVFTCIDLSNNNFQGDIPETIGYLNSLYVLNFSRNALTGPIPSTIGNLKQLESLDLSQNSLTGEIPYQLANLSFLSALNLSFNKLVGRIPLGSQFQTFQMNSFEGNDELCGTPLPNVCKSNTDTPQKYVHSKAGVDWQFILTGLGFGVGVGMILGPLSFWKTGRQWYNEHLNRILTRILPERLHHKFCDGDKIDPEETIEEELTDMSAFYYYYDDDEDEYNDGEFNGYYCVYCTKLDGRKVIHNPNCTCHKSPLNSY